MVKRLTIGIDLQQGFLTPEIADGDYIAKVSDFLKRQDPDSLLLTRFVNEPNGPFVKWLNWSEMQAGDPQNALFGDLEKQGYTIIEKSTYTAWLPAMQAKANELGAQEVVLFGLDSDACVLKTALDVFEANLRPIVLTDLCASSGGDTRHNMGLDLLTILIDQHQLTTSDTMPDGA